jgi:hypothetical protein
LTLLTTHDLKILHFYELLPYAPLIFDITTIFGKVVRQSGSKSSLLRYFKTKIGLNKWPINDEISGELIH